MAAIPPRPVAERGRAEGAKGQRSSGFRVNDGFESIMAFRESRPGPLAGRRAPRRGTRLPMVCVWMRAYRPGVSRKCLESHNYRGNRSLTFAARNSGAAKGNDCGRVRGIGD